MWHEKQEPFSPVGLPVSYPSNHHREQCLKLLFWKINMPTSTCLYLRIWRVIPVNQKATDCLPHSCDSGSPLLNCLTWPPRSISQSRTDTARKKGSTASKVWETLETATSGSGLNCCCLGWASNSWWRREWGGSPRLLWLRDCFEERCVLSVLRSVSSLGAATLPTWERGWLGWNLSWSDRDHGVWAWRRAAWESS